MKIFYAKIGSQDHTGFELDDGFWLDCHPLFGVSIHKPLRTSFYQVFELNLDSPLIHAWRFIGTDFSFKAINNIREGRKRTYEDGPPFMCSEFVIKILRCFNIKTSCLLLLPHDIQYIIWDHIISVKIRRNANGFS